MAGKFFERSYPSTNLHNEELSSLVSLLIAEAAIEPSSIERVVVGSGPGSFTGLRISLGFAKGFVFGTGASLLLQSSHYAFADEFKEHGDLFLVLSDARRDEAFTTIFQRNEEELTVLQGPLICSKAAAFDRIGTYCEQLKISQKRVVVVPFHMAQDWEPYQAFTPLRPAVSLAQYGRRELNAGAKELREVAALAPLYVRPVAAMTIEERFSASQKIGR